MSKIRVDTIVNESGSGSPNFSSGLTGTNGTFTGNLNVSGNISAGGTITYDDVTSVDSVGIVTCREDIKVNRNASITGITTFTGAIDANGGANIQGGSGVVIHGLTYPASDGSANQVLKTDGSGALGWSTPSSGMVKGWKHMSSTTGYSRANNSSWFEMPAYNLTYTPASADNFLLCTFTIALQNRFGSTGGSNASCAPKLSTDGGSSWNWAWSGFVMRNHNGLPASSYISATHSVTFVIDCANTNAHQFAWYGVTNTYGNTEAWFGKDVDGPSDDGQTNFQILELGPPQA